MRQSVTVGYYPATTIYPSLIQYSPSPKTRAKSTTSTPKNVNQHKTKTRKPFTSEQVWPSTSLPLRKDKFRTVQRKKKFNTSRRNKFHRNALNRRKRKNKLRPAKEKRKNLNRGVYKGYRPRYYPGSRRHQKPSKFTYFGIDHQNKKKSIDYQLQKTKQKRRKKLRTKLRRGNAYARQQPQPKSYPNNKRHSLLLLTRDGPRIPILETLGKAVHLVHHLHKCKSKIWHL